MSITSTHFAAGSGVTDPPHSDLDLFCDETLAEPYEAYVHLRALGSVVYLTRVKAYALTSYSAVRDALRQHEVFSSARGVTLNAAMNTFQSGTVLGSDPPQHTRLRATIAGPLAPAAIKALQADIQQRADVLVASLSLRGRFDAVEDLARAFPPGIVCDLIGLPKVGRRKLLHFTDMHFNAFGPLGPHLEGPVNQRAERGWAEMNTAMGYISFMAQRLSPGGMGAAIFAAAERGEITGEDALKLLASFLVAGLDTTVRSIGTAVHCFAEHPDQWRRICADRSLVADAYNEVLRYDSPSQVLTRCTTRECTVEGYRIPSNARVALLFASANRDEGVFPNAHRFDITRPAQPNLSFGGGVHACLGQVLARIEAHAVIDALARQVKCIEIDGAPERLLNSVLRGYSRLPIRVYPRSEWWLSCTDKGVA